jgi:hypothetical protein
MFVIIGNSWLTSGGLIGLRINRGTFHLSHCDILQRICARLWAELGLLLFHDSSVLGRGCDKWQTYLTQASLLCSGKRELS